MKKHPHRIIFMNGPPRSGKDFGTDLLAKSMENVRKYKMSAPLKSAVAAMFSLTYDEQKYLEANKDTVQKRLSNYTYRQCQINLSEHHMKPVYGDDIFGIIAKHTLFGAGRIAHDYTIISDSGFRSEAEPLVAAFGGRNCLLIRLHRSGTSFENDSRNYISLDDLGVHETDVENEFEPEFFLLQLQREIGRVWPDGIKE